MCQRPVHTLLVPAASQTPTPSYQEWADSPGYVLCEEGIPQMATATSCVTQCLPRHTCHYLPPGRAGTIPTPGLQFSELAGPSSPLASVPSRSLGPRFLDALCLGHLPHWVRSAFLPHRRKDVGNHLKRTQMERGEVTPRKFGAHSTLDSPYDPGIIVTLTVPTHQNTWAAILIRTLGKMPTSYCRDWPHESLMKTLCSLILCCHIHA